MLHACCAYLVAILRNSSSALSAAYQSIMHNHMNRFRYVIIFLASLLSSPAVAEDEAIAKLFVEQGVDGTIVISSLKTGQTFTHNDIRANQRFPIASTFKIMNTLIALEENAISGKDDVLEWDGQIYDIPDWNHDQTLESAFKVSCVWCYQELASRIGAEKYKNYLQKANYGEFHEPFEETTFWLDGSLQISAVEQVNFLQNVHQRTMPYRASTYETLRKIMLMEQAPTFSLWAKTGWAISANPQVGWYIGYVETKNDAWFFATNIQVRNKDDLSLRKKLTRAALFEKQIIE